MKQRVGNKCPANKPASNTTLSRVTLNRSPLTVAKSSGANTKMPKSELCRFFIRFASVDSDRRNAPSVQTVHSATPVSLAWMASAYCLATPDDPIKIFGFKTGLWYRIDRLRVRSSEIRHRAQIWVGHCGYFKVNVDFTTIENPSGDTQDRPGSDEDSLDLIAKVSKPYLEFKIAD